VSLDTTVGGLEVLVLSLNIWDFLKEATHSKD